MGVNEFISIISELGFEYDIKSFNSVVYRLKVYSITTNNVNTYLDILITKEYGILFNPDNLTLDENGMYDCIKVHSWFRDGKYPLDAFKTVGDVISELDKWYVSMVNIRSVYPDRRKSVLRGMKIDDVLSK